MLEREQVLEWLKGYTDDEDFFVVEVKIRPGEELEVDVDRDGGIDSDECGEVCRFLNAKLEEQGADWSVTVGSPGLTAPMRLVRQFHKNLDREVEVTLADGSKCTGVLTSVGEHEFGVRVQEKVKLEGEKRPKMVVREYVWAYDAVKQVVLKIGKR